MVDSLKGLEFDAVNHVYRLDGREIPSVTTVMTPLSDDIYGTVEKRVLDMAAARGTSVHNSIENHIKYGIDDIPPEYEGYFQAFLTWEKDFNVKAYASEFRVYHKALMYAGTIDLLADVANVATMVDFKTSASVQKELGGMQLEAYNQCLKSHRDGDGYDAKIIVHLKKDGEYDIVNFPANDIESWRVFTALLTIKNFKNKLSKGE